MKKSILALTVLGLTLCACTKDDVSNNAPNIFEVTVTPKVVSRVFIDEAVPKNFSKSKKNTEYEYIVTWTEAIDPDGDTVTYDVVIANSTIATAISETTATISENNLGEGATQTVTVIAKDDNGGETVINKTFTEAKS